VYQAPFDVVQEMEVVMLCLEQGSATPWRYDGVVMEGLLHMMCEWLLRWLRKAMMLQLTETKRTVVKRLRDLAIRCSNYDRS